METVSIVGVGLIGGSFALALRKAGFKGRIIGVSSPRTVAEALRLKVVDEALPIAEAAPQSNLVYLSQPITRILETLERLDRHLKPGALVTDAGSTKETIVETARAHLSQASFLGGHPMAGKESRGVAAAEADLFVNRPYLLTPAKPSHLRSGPAREFVDWLRRIGARPIVVTPNLHDRVVALGSHLPQLASTALASALAGEEESAEVRKVAGPGLQDMIRLALSPYEIWSDIIETNSVQIEEALGIYIRELEQIRARLRSAELEGHFTKASNFARAARKKSGG